MRSRNIHSLVSSFLMTSATAFISLAQNDSLSEKPTTSPIQDSIINEEFFCEGFMVGSGLNNGIGIGEIGYGFTGFRPLKYLTGRENNWLPKNYMVAQAYLTSEFYISGTRTVVAPKFGLSIALSFININYFNFLYYTDFKRGAFVYRPEIGITFFGHRLYYGYNWLRSNKVFINTNRHQLGICFFINTVKPKHVIRYYKAQ